MKKIDILLVIICVQFISWSLLAQDTFSIVAVDTETGQIGSAGASCLDNDDIEGGVYIISKIIPGLGAINTQSYWNPQNQENATTKMVEGLSADAIISWLVQNDVQNNAAIRQYGISVISDNNLVSAAAFTGDQCLDVKNHIVGDYYSIQGNILISEEILESMEENFLNTEGSLAEKLMAAMQGANVPGADSRCLSEGVSSQSAFLRVAESTDDADNLSLDLLVAKTDFGVEPIDSLQKLFDAWVLVNTVNDAPIEGDFQIYPNPVVDEFTAIYQRYDKNKKTNLVIRDPSGKQTQYIQLTGKETKVKLRRGKIPSGQYYYSLQEDGIILKQSAFVVITE